MASISACNSSGLERISCRYSVEPRNRHFSSLLPIACSTARGPREVASSPIDWRSICSISVTGIFLERRKVGDEFGFQQAMQIEVLQYPVGPLHDFAEIRRRRCDA